MNLLGDSSIMTTLKGAFISAITILAISSTSVISDTRVPHGEFGNTLFPFVIEGVGEVEGHSGYALHYWNEAHLPPNKKLFLHLSDYDYEDSFRTFQKNIGQWNEWWDESYGNIYKARKANLIYEGHRTTAGSATLRNHTTMVFVPRDTSIGVRKNAENLAAALTRINEMATAMGLPDNDGDGFPDFELIVIADGLSGLWARAAFAQEQSNFGIDKLITVNTPHKGIVTSFGIASYLSFLSFGSDAALEIQAGRSNFNTLFSWLEGEETEAFISTTIDPMDTIAVAYSNGEASWDLLWAEWFEHTVYHTAASIIDLAQIEALLQEYNEIADNFLTEIYGPDHGFALTLGNSAQDTTTLVPYHSAIMADLPYNTNELKDWTTLTSTGFLTYEANYITTDSRYFDTKVSFLKTDGSPNDSFYLTLDPVGIAEKHTFLWPLISL